MLFNSLTYAIFLPIVFTIYWLLPSRFRWLFLLVSSYYFYMNWHVKSVILIIGTTIISYLAAIAIEKVQNQKTKKVLLALSVLACLSGLLLFKYLDFAIESLNSLMSFFSLKLHLTTVKLFLPIGISFYTFQTLSYVIDVYKGKVKAERHFGHYATFISYFPQLVAGPIERTNALLPQIKAQHYFNYNQAVSGLKLMAWGFFKKMVIADNIADYVGMVFNNPQNYTGFALVLSTLFFTFQIYCDFSGYSDIAIGTSRLLGINLMTNFSSPYFSQSIKEFWNRWHISLSSWLKDYVYIPLGGNRVRRTRHIFNLLVTFLISGLWHGANWTFVIWGAIHGIGSVLENALPKKLQQTKSTGILGIFRVLFVFIFVAFAWIFFVSNSVTDAIYVLNNSLVGISSFMDYLSNGFQSLNCDFENMLRLSFFIIILGLYDYGMIKGNTNKWISERPVIMRWILYITLGMIIFLYAKPSGNSFVYFQF